MIDIEVGKRPITINTKLNYIIDNYISRLVEDGELEGDLFEDLDVVEIKKIEFPKAKISLDINTEVIITIIG